MKTIINDIRIPFTANPEEAVSEAVKRSGMTEGIKAVICKKSIDARHKNNICFVYSVMIQDGEPEIEDKSLITDFGNEILSAPPLICGFGPCGMFTALALAEQGYKPTVIERGGDVDERAVKVENFYNTGVLDTETNVQFGAGGAGTFSDGKLTTRINDPKCRYILERLVEFGAPEEILIEAKPHIGTDKLRCIVEKLKERIIELGGTVHFNTKLIKINYIGGRAVSVTTNQGDYPCGAIVIATGHSARDVYSLLADDSFDIVPKAFSVGVRIEHLQSDIDKAAYGASAGHELLGHADYAFSKRIGDRAVYTFCMCPGGEVIAAASENNGIVLNGMSRYKRDGVNANSALVVSVNPENPIEFQRMLERAAYSEKYGFAAPAQTVGDFVNGVSKTVPKRVMPSYMNGNVRMYDLNRLFPKYISDMLKTGISEFNIRLNGFGAEDAVLTGVETRTSAPVRVKRNDESYIANGFENVYPCGEGAGYAGGIMSAAADGVNCALKIMSRYCGNRNG